MRITFTRGTCLGGIGNDAHPGEVRELPDAHALRLIAAGRARLAPAPTPTPTPEPAPEKRKPARLLSRAKSADPKDN